jgi:hypothetical protein
MSPPSSHLYFLRLSPAGAVFDLAFKVCAGCSTLSQSSSCRKDSCKNHSAHVTPLPSVFSLFSISQIPNRFSPLLSTDARANATTTSAVDPAPSLRHNGALPPPHSSVDPAPPSPSTMNRAPMSSLYLLPPAGRASSGQTWHT